MNYSIIIAVMLLCTQCSTTVTLVMSDEINQKKAEDIKKLVQLTRSSRFALQMLRKVIVKYQVSYPEIKDDYWLEFLEEADLNNLTELLIPVFDRQFSHDEIKELLIFYESPIGQKVTRMLPNMTVEIFMVGVQWVREVAEKIDERLQREGHMSNQIDHRREL